MEPKDRLVNPEDRRETWQSYKNTNGYQKMTKSQRMVLDHAEENGRCGSLRYSKADMKRWEAKRADMTEAEILEMEAKASKKGTIAGIGFLAIVAVAMIACVMTCMELAG